LKSEDEVEDMRTHKWRNTERKRSADVATSGYI